MSKNFVDIEIKGLDEVQKKLGEIEGRIKSLDGLSFDKLFNEKFMRRHTEFDNFTDFVIKSKLIPPDTKVITKEMFEGIPDEKWDDYIAKTTYFKSWGQMQEIAVKEYIGL